MAYILREDMERDEKLLAGMWKSCFVCPDKKIKPRTYAELEYNGDFLAHI